MLKQIIMICALAVPAGAESVVANHTLRAGIVITSADVTTSETIISGALRRTDAAIGLELKRSVYQGHPIRANDLIEPALIERNAIIPLIFEAGGLRIVTEGRALAEGRAGETIRIMNLGSRSTVFGLVQPNGTVEVKG